MLQRCSSNSPSTFSFIFPSMSPAAMDEPHYSSSAVDCTLSLATPSTRYSAVTSVQRSSSAGRGGSSSLCWDIIAKTQQQAAASPRELTATASSNMGGSDPLLLARRCASCDTTSTPLWRNGPRGPKSLCNACGIRYKKEERRAAASTSSPPASNLSDPIGSYAAPYHHMQQQQQQHPWMTPSSSTKDMDPVPSFLSWRLNVVPPPHPSLGLYQFQ